MQDGVCSELMMWEPRTDVKGSGYWPTPCARDHHPNGMKPGSKVDFGNAVKMWPTPRASEWKGVGPLGSKSHQYRLDKSYLDATVQEAEGRTGKLNPEWVEWLMGWPIGWTDLKPLETDKPPNA
tara:strand:- start:252 stop:623 length:372 start_codon:yes stop_codon:yes gene_type:complete